METPIKIFLVDDDPFSLNIYKEELEHSGYKDISVHNSSNACIRNLSEKPRVIFLDHNMDEMNGLDLLRKIRGYYPEIYVIMVSGRQCVRTAVQALKYGAYDYILKGDNEVKRMKTVLRQIQDQVETPEEDGPVKKLVKNQSRVVLLLSFLLVLQSGVLAYYYSSVLVSMLATVIVFLITVIAFMYRRRTEP